MKILVIDDNPAVRATLKLVLGSEFDNVTAIADPRLLPALLARGDYDAVLLDMNFDTSRLDGSDGLFWLSRIMETETPPAVILITAFGDISLAVEGMKSGALDFVTKPWNNDELISKIRNAVARNVRSRHERRAAAEANQMKKREEELRSMTLDEIKQTHIREVINQCGGNLSQAAERLGINRQTLYNQLKKS